MDKLTYSEKLLDPRWQRKRLEILGRDNFTCRGCQSKTKTLHIHHMRYERGHDPWDYEDSLLVTLCKDCHSFAPKIDWEGAFLELGLCERELLDLAQGLVYWRYHDQEIGIRDIHLKLGLHGHPNEEAAKVFKENHYKHGEAD